MEKSLSSYNTSEYVLKPLQDKTIVCKINRFVYTPYFMLVIGVLTAISNHFSLEGIIYPVFSAIAIFIMLLGTDFLPIVPMVVCCYIAPSAVNNPGANQHSFFYSNGGYVAFLGVIIALSFIFRIAFDKQLGRKIFFTCDRKLALGMLTLGLSYLLSGVGSGRYFANGLGNLLFGFLQFVSLFLFYFIFTACIKWEQVPKNYFSMVGTSIGLILLVEITSIYFTNNVIVAGQIYREKIYSGWGNYNNIASLLTMMIPFTFHLAFNSKRFGLFLFLSMLFCGGVLACCSRGSILVCFVICVLCIIALLTGSKNKLPVSIFIVSILLISFVIFCIFKAQIINLFGDLIATGLDSVPRILGYKQGIEQFLESPVFGGSFYPMYNDLYSWSSVDSFIAFFPPRWHNTFVQMLASCGIVGLGAYLYHRVQTIILLWKNRSYKNIFISISILTLLLTSLLDCHFFNIGPALFYSTALAFIEKDNKNPL